MSRIIKWKKQNLKISLKDQMGAVLSRAITKRNASDSNVNINKRIFHCSWRNCGHSPLRFSFSVILEQKFYFWNALKAILRRFDIFKSKTLMIQLRMIVFLFFIDDLSSAPFIISIFFLHWRFNTSDRWNKVKRGFLKFSATQILIVGENDMRWKFSGNRKGEWQSNFVTLIDHKLILCNKFSLRFSDKPRLFIFFIFL